MRPIPIPRSPSPLIPLVLATLTALAPRAQEAAEPAGFTIEQVLSAPFPSSLKAAPAGARVGWVFDRAGRRSIFVAEGPDFAARELIAFDGDDGRPLAVEGLSPDGAVVVFARGGPHNPDHDPQGATASKLYRIGWDGGAVTELCEARSAALSPARDELCWAKGGEVWRVSLAGEPEPERILATRGTITELRWSPDGERLALCTARESFDQGYSFVAVFDVGTAKLHYVDPGVYHDRAPRWSPDGKRLAFLRRLRASEGSVLTARAFPTPDPWDVRIADLRSSETISALGTPEVDSFAEAALEWLTDGALVVRSERDGFARLWLLDAARQRLRPLSPAGAEVESFTVRGGRVSFTTNAGDVDRRHLWLGGARGAARQLTAGESIEWSPAPTGDGRFLVHLASDARRPAHVAVLELDGGDGGASGTPRRIADETLPADFPLAQLVVPEQVVFDAVDGTEVHGQLFRPPERFAGPRPALSYFHGGPMRQMLLGWHYSPYYHKAYAFNQYLASRGYCVLAVNYRLGIGYGKAFRDVADGGPRGAAEYRDVLAAAAFLRGCRDVDQDRIGLWGGSYGGYLTALGLARNSDLFAAGVDFHGVHDWNTWQAAVQGRGAAEDDRTAWKASPVADLDSWRSPVLLVHGDDDRNVAFSETIRLVRELERRGVPHELVVLPDEVHSFLRHASWVRAFEAAGGFLDRKLRDRATPNVPIRIGSARYEIQLDGTVLEVFTYKPESYRGERMIMVMHGTLRNADEYRDHAQAMGDRFGALIVAPRFDRERFPSSRYQFGGILTRERAAAPRGEWTYRFIPELAGAVRAMERQTDLPFWIIGHSAGGQFVVRMAAFMDTGAERLVAANPGSHLFPTREMPFGYGFGDLPDELSDDGALRRYLAAPLTLYLGTDDDGPDQYFDRSRTAMQQGEGRWQRGKACFLRAQELALANGWQLGWRLVEADGIEHDHQKMFDHERCADALFGAEPAGGGGGR